MADFFTLPTARACNRSSFANFSANSSPLFTLESYINLMTNALPIFRFALSVHSTCRQLSISDEYLLNVYILSACSSVNCNPFPSIPILCF
jgi:hypothetical protein